MGSCSGRTRTLLVFLFIGLTFGQTPVRVEELTILNADRTIDLTSQVVLTTTKIKLENTNASPTKHFLFAIDPLMKSHVSLFEAKDSIGGKPLKSTIVQVSTSPSVLVYRIDLASELAKGKTTDLEIDIVYTKYLQPFPEEIAQKDKQFIKFVGNHYLYSPYKVVKQSTKATLASKNIESISKLKPFTQSENVVTFGAYENIDPFTTSECILHYENNGPFLVVANMERLIEVSHWGNIAVEEKIEIYHAGAKLKGSFSRFEFQRDTSSGVNSIKMFKTILPSAARDVYYRDDIGNISTSNMYVKHDSVELTLRPRFPLFGGWKTRYVLGYNVPSYEYLFSEGGHYKLKLRLLDHIYDSMVVEDFTVKIILPEGASNIKLKTPYQMKELPRSLHYTYLDITGRPVINLVGKNMVENHIQDFILDYDFPMLYLLREPIMIISVFMILFFTILVWVRLDFSIGKDKNKGSSSNNATVVDSVIRKHGKRATIYENLDSQIAKLKTTKDVNSFQTSLKNMTTEHKVETTAINEIMLQQKNESPSFAESIYELQKLDRGMWEVYIQYIQAVEKLVGAKMNRQMFMDQDNLFTRKRDELAEKINQLIKNL